MEEIGDGIRFLLAGSYIPCEIRETKPVNHNSPTAGSADS